MILTTTPAIEGKPVRQYHGVVTGEAILGANIFRDFFAGIRDIVGGRSAAYEQELAKAREIAFEEMTEQALSLGANAVIGIDIDRGQRHDADGCRQRHRGHRGLTASGLRRTGTGGARAAMRGRHCAAPARRAA